MYSLCSVLSSLIPGHFHYQKETLQLLAVSPNSPSPPPPRNHYFLPLWIYLFWTFKMNWIIKCVWSFVPGLFPLACFKVHPCCSRHLYFIPFYGWLIFHCVDRQRCVYPFICWWTLGCFHFLLCSIMNNAAVNTFTYKFLCECIFMSLGCMCRSGIVGSCGNFILNFWRSCQAFFHSGFTILNSH